MSAFKDVIASDVKGTFISADEFADTYFIDNLTIPVLVDNDELMDNQPQGSKHLDDMAATEILIFVAASDYGDAPRAGTYVTFGKTEATAHQYLVTNCNDADGMYAITMELYEI